MRVVFMGTPDYALPALEGLLGHGYPVVGVYTRPDRPAGRGLRARGTPVKVYAQAHDLPVFQPRSLRGEVVAEELASLAPGVIVVAAYGRMLPPEVLEIPTKGVLNIHPSLIPKYRGPSPVAAAILNGEAEAAVTVMLVDQGMDTGAILMQQRTALLGTETMGRLTNRLFKLGAEALVEVLPQWTTGILWPTPQDESQATYSRLFVKEDGALDWSLPANVLERCVRAFDPWPGCYTLWEGKRLKVLESALVEDAGPEGTIGQVVGRPSGSGPAVAMVTGQGLLGLVKVQLAGRQPQAIDAFVRGYPRFVGACLPS